MNGISNLPKQVFEENLSLSLPKSLSQIILSVKTILTIEAFLQYNNIASFSYVAQNTKQSSICIKISQKLEERK